MKTPILILIGFAIISSSFTFNLQVSSGESYNIPSWIKNNAKFWSQGEIDDADFVKGIQYLLEQGIRKEIWLLGYLNTVDSL